MRAMALAFGAALLLPGCSETDGALDLCTGDYAFAQIDDWFQQLSPELMTLPGVYSIDADERYDCVMVGIASLAVKAPVRSKAEEVGVPTDAIGFEVTDQAVPLEP